MDNRKHAKDRNIMTGDRVLVKQRKINKLTPKFQPHPYTVTDTNGTMITAESEITGKKITRNISFYKEIPKDAEFPIVLKEEDEIDDGQDILNVGVEEEGEPLKKTYPKRLKRHPDHWRKY